MGAGVVFVVAIAIGIAMGLAIAMVLAYQIARRLTDSRWARFGIALLLVASSALLGPYLFVRMTQHS